MTKHSEFSRRHLKDCNCTAFAGGKASKFAVSPVPWPLTPMYPYTVTHDEERVMFLCRGCKSILADFYRMPHREEQRILVNRELVAISTKRVVAWVGYARNPATLPVNDGDLLDLAALELVKALRDQTTLLYSFTTKEIKNKEEAIEAAKSVLCSSGNTRLRTAMKHQARYNMLREAYKEKPLKHRGFWFQDHEFKGGVVGLAACQTGTQYPAHGGTSCDWEHDDYEPGGLAGGVYQRLYCALDELGHAALIHPLDVI